MPFCAMSTKAGGKGFPFRLASAIVEPQEFRRRPPGGGKFFELGPAIFGRGTLIVFWCFAVQMGGPHHFSHSGAIILSKQFLV